MPERLSRLDSQIHQKIKGEPPSFFGAEGSIRQETKITDIPLEISQSEYYSFVSMAAQVVSFIKSFPNEKLFGLGIEDDIVTNYLNFDDKTRSKFLYGGLDIYGSKERGFKLLEINSLVQAMGLQDFRLANLGIFEQPMIFQHFLEEIIDRHKSVLVLGSKRNPFWRGHNRISELLNEFGINSKYSDTQSFEDSYNSGFRPDLILRLCNSNHILYSPEAAFLRGIVLRDEISVINALHSPVFGSRGFLQKLAESNASLLPDQIVLDENSTTADFQNYPWIKVEIRDFSYVVNFSELKKWARDSVIALVKKDFNSFEHSIVDKSGGDAEKLRGASRALAAATDDEIRWIGQQHVEPLQVNLPVAGVPTDLKILHRIYWVKSKDGLKVSIEGFGCAKDQYSKSKGKINGGTGISVPMVIIK